MQFGIRGPIPGDTLRAKAEALRRAGYSGIELGHEWLKDSADAILRQLDGTGIAVSAIVGSIGLLNPDPQARQAAVETTRERLHMAKALGTKAVIEVPVFGSPKFNDLPAGTGEHEYGKQILVEGLRKLAPTIEETGVTLILEPLNRYETRFMNRLEQASEAIDAAGSKGVKILCDLFHMHIEERSIADSLRTAGEHVGYIHLADSNRQLPGAGHTDFRSGFDALKRIGYDGWLVIESGYGLPGEPEDQLRRTNTLLHALWDTARG